MQHNRIRELREKKKWTQQELADELKVTPATLSRWESGKVNPGAAQLQKLARVLDATVSAILSEPGTITVASTIVGFIVQGSRAGMYITDGTKPWQGIREVSAPIHAQENTWVVEVRGDVLEPVFGPGQLLYFPLPNGIDPRALRARFAIVQVKGGEAYVRQVRPSVDGLGYDLILPGEETMLSAEVEWASPIVWIQDPLSSGGAV